LINFNPLFFKIKIIFAKNISLKIFQSINEYNSLKKSIVTIGTFDGVHIGHQKILYKVIETADKENCTSVVLTFFPHPRMVIQNDESIKLLNSIQEKKQLFEKLNLNNLIIHPFDEVFSQLTAEEFVSKILVEKLNLKKIIIGYDHRFGKNRTANIDDLKLYGEKYNFEVEQISAQEIDEIAVSSTKVRTALLNGEITKANSYLGYNYSLSGVVVQGKKIGRTIGFPTANIQIEVDYKLIPKKGVYLVKSTIQNNTVFGLMNIGNRPTVDGKNQSIEVYFLDFDHDLYNQSITVEFIDFIREEQKFNSLDDLKNQIEKDKITGLRIIETLL
jgi:riboflavin kinase/FMN adenylyltransferase